ncbi:hypothetical protein QQ045_003768 [Rhodiola kirilowii]
MSTIRGWMYRRLFANGTGITYEFRTGVAEFLNFASNEKSMDSKCMIRCPCVKCKNMHWKVLDDVKYDLYRYGFLEGYEVWRFHGEQYEQVEEEIQQSESHQQVSGDENIYDAVEMLIIKLFLVV